MVLVSGCHFADCHYINANRATVKRILRLWDKLQKLKIRPERLQLEWISAAEGQKFANVMRKLDSKRAEVSEDEIEYTVEVLKADKLKGAVRKAAIEQLKSPIPPSDIALPPVPEGYSIFSCLSCGHIYTAPYNPKAELNEWSCPLPDCKSNSIRLIRKRA